MEEHTASISTMLFEFGWFNLRVAGNEGVVGIVGLMRLMSVVEIMGVVGVLEVVGIVGGLELG